MKPGLRPAGMEAATAFSRPLPSNNFMNTPPLNTGTPHSAKLPITLGTLILIALVVSGIAPYERLTWLLEVTPVLIALPLLAVTWRRFPLTNLLYILIATQALILILGGAYTYANVPLGFWMQDVFAFSRNNYDKIGHFAQGAVPAMIAREILIRGHYVTGRRMTAFLCICIALAISAFYELIEWWAALVLDQGADEFLGTQGDPWDTQSDMFFALIGASVVLPALSRLHDRGLALLARRPAPHFSNEL